VRVVAVPPAWRKIKLNGSLLLVHNTCYRGPTRLSLRLYSFNDDASEIGNIFLSDTVRKWALQLYSFNVESSVTHGLHDFIFLQLIKTCDFIFE
jgi:hypothetical protein